MAVDQDANDRQAIEQVNLFAILTVRAEPIEIEPVADDLKARLLSHLLAQSLGQAHLWIYDLAAADADQVRVWVRPVSIVTIVVVTEAQLQDLVDVLQEIQRFVDGPRARGGELVPELVVQPRRAGVTLAGGQEAEQGYTLWRQPVLALLEPGHQFFEPQLWIDHVFYDATIYRESVSADNIPHLD